MAKTRDGTTGEVIAPRVSYQDLPARSGEYRIGCSPETDGDEEGPPESRASAWTQCSADYQLFASGITRPFARDAARLMRITPGARVLDVAAGTGEFALAAAKRGGQVLATDFSPQMLSLLEQTCRQQGLTSIETAQMDGQALGLPGCSFDVTGSLFGLVFFPEPERGLSEMYRVLVPGGHGVVGTWAPPARVELMRVIGEALWTAGIEPLPPSGPASEWMDLSSPRRLTQLFEDAGFRHSYAIEVAHVWTFPRVDDVARALLRMTPAWFELYQGLCADQRRAFATALASDFRQRQGQGPFAVTAHGLLAVGTK